MTFIVYPYKMYSAAGKTIAAALGAVRVREAGRFRPRPHHTIINWGNTHEPNWDMDKPNLILNLPYHVERSSNKLNTYRVLKEADINVPPFTTDPTTALSWSSEGSWVLARQVLRGHSGQGIVEIPPGTNAAELAPAPVYTKYLPKRHEFRIHILGSTVIDVQAKRRKSSIPDSQVNWRIRSNANGFIFCRQDLSLSPATREVAIQAVQALSLDFGAVDIIINNHKPFVLEVNTAPGLSPTTVANYAAAFLTHDFSIERTRHA